MIEIIQRPDPIQWTISSEQDIAPEWREFRESDWIERPCPSPLSCWKAASLLHPEAVLAWDYRNGALSFRRSADLPVLSARVWAEFAPSFNPKKLKIKLIGDFDGNGWNDLVVVGLPFAPSRIALSHGDFAIEDDFPWPFQFPRDGRVYRAADPNQDGLSDIVEFDPKTNRGILAINTPQNVKDEPCLLAVEAMEFPVFQSFISFAPWVIWQYGSTRDRFLLPFSNYPQRVHLILPRSRSWETPRWYVKNLGRNSRTSKILFPIDPVVEERERQIVGRLHEEGSLPGLRPKVCLGYSLSHPYPISTLPGKWSTDGLCPPDFAYFGASEGGEDGSTCSWLNVSCCPLPAGDILDTESTWVRDTCPEGFMATGHLNDDGASCSNQMRCTRLNHQKYVFGPPQNGRYWGSGLSVRGQGRQLSVSEIPLGIRYGVTRGRFDQLSVDGCIAEIPGSVLTKKGGKKCNEFEFREIHFRNESSRDHVGIAVPMFPRCRSLEDIFFGNSGCFLDQNAPHS